MAGGIAFAVDRSLPGTHSPENYAPAHRALLTEEQATTRVPIFLLLQFDCQLSLSVFIFSYHLHTFCFHCLFSLSLLNISFSISFIYLRFQFSFSLFTFTFKFVFTYCQENHAVDHPVGRNKRIRILIF